MHKNPLNTRLGRTAKYLSLTILLIILIAALWWLIITGLSTAWKIITYDASSISDFLVFPKRTLTAGQTPFQFKQGDQNRVPEKLAAEGLGEIELEAFLQDSETVAFLVIKDDRILKENYYQGYTAATPTLAFSMSKSFLSILLGMAIADGYIASVEQYVTDFVPKLTGAGFDRVTLEHLLQMTSGMNYVEVVGNPFALHTRFYYTNRLVHELLRLRLKEEPGRVFSYKTGENALLGLILARAIAPLTITEYTQEKLWEPLGMEYDGSWNLDHEGGLEKTWCCLAATLRDYAKLGRLYLHEGDWNGQQLLPAEWVAVSTRLDTREGSAWNYQYQWWLVSDQGDFMAMGHQGQFVYVNPEQQTIIVRLGHSRGGFSWDEWRVLLTNLSRAID